MYAKSTAPTLRFTLVTGNTPGNDMRFYMERVEANRNFANKIWNASKFVIMNLTDYDETFVPEESDLTLADRWILTSFNDTVRKVTADFDNFELGDAADAVYNFIWNSYCDWYIELAKQRLYKSDDERSKRTVQYVLVYVLTHTLEMLHLHAFCYGAPVAALAARRGKPHRSAVAAGSVPVGFRRRRRDDEYAHGSDQGHPQHARRIERVHGQEGSGHHAPATDDMAKTLKTYETYFHTLAFADHVTLLAPGEAKRKTPS